MPQRLAASQAGQKAEGRERPSYPTQQERGTSPFSWAAPGGAGKKWVNTVLSQNSLFITSSQWFAISYMIFAATGISVALKRSVTAWQLDQLMLGMSSLHHCVWAKGEAVCTSGTKNTEQQEFSGRTKYISK